jgi:uncharacterized protein (TIGR03435 family)
VRPLTTQNRRIVAVSSFLALLSCEAYSQAVSVAPEFEAVNVRPSQPGLAAPSTAFLPGGEVNLHNLTMKQLIVLAYQEIFNNDYVKGGPDWLDSARYDLVAKAPTKTPVGTVRTMLQPVLLARFHLAIHREQRPMPVYVLLVGKRGQQLKGTDGSGQFGCVPALREDDGRTHRLCHNMTMAQLAYALPGLAPRYIDRPVIDLTNITGAYDFQLDWTPLPTGAADVAAGPTIFDSLDKELGLKLESQRQPMPIIVIDRVDRVPDDH